MKTRRTLAPISTVAKTASGELRRRISQKRTCPDYSCAPAAKQPTPLTNMESQELRTFGNIKDSETKGESIKTGGGLFAEKVKTAIIASSESKAQVYETKNIKGFPNV